LRGIENGEKDSSDRMGLLVDIATRHNDVADMHIRRFDGLAVFHEMRVGPGGDLIGCAIFGLDSEFASRYGRDGAMDGGAHAHETRAARPLLLIMFLGCLLAGLGHGGSERYQAENEKRYKSRPNCVHMSPKTMYFVAERVASRRQFPNHLL
jgi:hypothetical protein